MVNTLYAKLAAVLLALLLTIGLIYTVTTVWATRHHIQQVHQQLSRDLASNLVMDRNLVAQDQLNDEALKETFHQYMVINPSIEIYLLDTEGRILSYSADPGKVKRKRVALAPIQAFLRGETAPLGDDPRSHDRRKAFSVTPVPSADNLQGYLYVVLQGEEFDSINNIIRDSYLVRLSAGAVAASLVIGLLAGLLIFHYLTRRLHRLATLMETFRGSNFTHHTAYADGQTHRKRDEIDTLGRTFDQMAQRIQRLLAELKYNDQLRRELVAQVSHDLRTPLAAIRGYLETLQLKEGTLTQGQRDEYFRLALRQSEHLSHLVDALFELAKLDAKEPMAHCEAFPIAEFIHDVYQKFGLQAEAKRIRYTLQLTDNLPFVLADIGLIERVMENLLDNAFRHTPEGGRITIAATLNQQQVAISIRDSGAGIDESDLPHIFERFYQAKNRCQEHTPHTGLGLAIVKRIMELHNSEIKVSSTLGEGTVFSFYLPAQ